MRGARNAFTLAEVLMVTLIAMFLATMTYASWSSAIENAREAQCLSNLRQWGVALGLYVADHDGRIPRRGQGVRPVEIVNRPDDWFNCLPPYLGLPGYGKLVSEGREPKAREKSIFVCPTAKDLKKPHFLAYGMNMHLSPWNQPDMDRLPQIPSPSQLAFLADGPGGWSSTIPSGDAYSVSARHRDRANVLFVDGHVRTFPGKYLGCGTGEISNPDIRWTTGIGGKGQ